MKKRYDMLDAGICLVMDEGVYPYGHDAVLLSRFVPLKKGEKLLDLGAASGVLAFLLLGREKDLFIDCVEIDPEAVSLLKEGIRLNALEEKVRAYCNDIRDFRSDCLYDTVISNPPYAKAKRVQKHVLARTRAGFTYEDLCCVAHRLLKPKGRLISMCPAPLLFSFAKACQKNGLEIKRLQFVQSLTHKPPYLVLIEARKDVNAGVTYEPTVVLSQIKKEEAP
ncbi:MAG: tRNA1(Val) (adenine(37)-N6)-methyltransferase [Christensenellales bacterium]|jgi:tRNA1Val (adenine37-N6)-methyltransferase